MIVKPDNLKNEITHILSYYSKYYCQQFIDCEYLFAKQKGHFALFSILALLENIIKSTLNDFESTFHSLNIILKDRNLINEVELNFLNDSKIGVRKIRNILAHANLSKYDLVVDDNEITFPFTENETCLILYESLSTIISGLVLKILKPSLVLNYEIDVDILIEKLNFKFIIRTPEELMGFKGIPLTEEWYKLDNATKYRLVENSPNAFILSKIFKGINLK